MSEDPPEDITQHAEFRARCEAATGWNGSNELFKARPIDGVPCPPELWARLQAARQAAAARAAAAAPPSCNRPPELWAQLQAARLQAARAAWYRPA